jgi:hypothetical protein
VKPSRDESRSLLANRNGFLALASDAPLGEVERPLFAAEYDGPDYLLVRLSPAGGRTAVVPTSLFAIVELDLRRLIFRASLAEVLQLQATLSVSPDSSALMDRRKPAR